MRSSKSKPETSSWVVGRLALFFAFALVQHSAVGARSERPGTLFIGNSLTYFNRGPRVYGAFGHHRRVVDEIMGSGYTLTQHLDDARMPWTRVAALPYIARGRYRTVVMQDAGWRIHQYGQDASEREAALQGARTFARQARAWGARLVLYEQPYRAGVTQSFQFIAQQSAVRGGYHELARALREDGTEVRIAPVGYAFALVAMQSPQSCAEGEEFDLLFLRDNHHPSLRGTYLAMALIYATANDTDVRNVPDEPRLGPTVSARLRYFAHLAMKDERRRAVH